MGLSSSSLKKIMIGFEIRINTVSYTHLNLDGDAGSNAEHLLTIDADYYTPVSYTHLDVYKRQDTGGCISSERKKRGSI